MGTKVYRGYTYNDYLNPLWYTVEESLFKSLIDRLPAFGDTLVTTEHTHAKLVASDGVPDPAIQCDADGNLIVGTGIASADCLAHFYAGNSSGTLDAKTKLLLEHSDDAAVQVMVPNGKVSAFVLGNDTEWAQVRYDSTSKELAFYANNLKFGCFDGDASKFKVEDGVDIQFGHSVAGGSVNCAGTIVILDKAGAAWKMMVGS
jgi:hypothetical protein